MTKQSKRLRAVRRETELAAESHISWAHSYVAEARAGHWPSTPWRERSVADVAALKGVELHQARQRADGLAESGAGLAVIIVPQRIEDPAVWERKAAALDAEAFPALAGVK